MRKSFNDFGIPMRGSAQARHTSLVLSVSEVKVEAVGVINLVSCAMKLLSPSLLFVYLFTRFVCDGMMLQCSNIKER